MLATTFMSSGSAYDVVPHCNWDQREHANDNALVEVNVIYENGTYIQGTTLHVNGYWGIFRLLDHSWSSPFACIFAIAGHEYAVWTVNVNGYPTFSWTWAPKEPGEHTLAYIMYSTEATTPTVTVYDANVLSEASLSEFPAIAITLIGVLIVSLLLTRNVRSGEQRGIAGKKTGPPWFSIISIRILSQ